MPNETLYVENTLSDDVTVIDVAAGKAIGSIQIGGHPDDVVPSMDGKMLYVNRQASRDVVAVDPSKGEIMWTVPVEGLPHHMALSADARHLYVALYDEPSDCVIDVEARGVVARPATGIGSHGVFRSAAGERFYVGSMFLDHIAVVEASTLQTTRAIPMEEGVRPFDLTRDEKRLYAQLSKTHGFHVVNLETDEVVEHVALPALPPDVEMPRRFPHTVNHGLKLSRDERLLFAAATIADYVAVYSLPAHEFVASIPVGREPGWVIVSHDGSACYVTNREDDTVSILSVADLEEVTRIPTGRYPQRMASVPR